MPGFAFIAEIGTKEGSVGTVFNDEMTSLACFRLTCKAGVFARVGVMTIRL
jgi:hypothetical protein